jgi:TolB-like protein/class 3 adenylate cyclase/predicted ATPase
MVDGEISFGPFRLDLARRELRRDNSPIRLGRRALDILCVLASARGGLVTKDELMAQVWPRAIVEENNLHFQISSLRKVLDADGKGETWIVTIPRRGYRLLRPPEPSVADKSAPARTMPVADEPSLAVLPFLNLSGDSEQEYFADGMVEEITTALARIRWLSVTARNSSFTYKGQNVDVKRVGRELGVRYLLEGSVRKSGNRVRITCQLIDAVTGAHLWADRFDGSLEDVFDLQDKVASSVAGVIGPALQEVETARSTGRPTTDVAAYDLYLRAHALVWSSARQIPEALGLLEQAIACDPHYGPALAWAAMCCYRLCVDGSDADPEGDSRKGFDFAQRALKVAGDDPEVIVNAALALSYFGEDIDAMIGLVDRALALNPNFARGWHVGGILRLFAGHPDPAIEHAETALRLSPRARVGTSLSLIGQAHFLARRFDEAVPKLLLAIQEDPSFPAPYRYLAACYAHMARLGEARAIVARLRRINGEVWGGAAWFRNAEQRELYLSGLRLAAGADNDSVAAPPVVDLPRDPRSMHHLEAERRQITALCCELVGAAPGGDGADLEELREAVGGFQCCVSEAAERHQGVVYRDLGNSALVLFGYPEAHEHDAEQAVRAGLELCAAVRALRPDADAPVRCRVGIATGMVIVGDPVGVGAARGESLVGDAPNLAARLSLSAQADTVVIEPSTRRLIGNLFDYRELAAIETAGGAEPIRNWQVLRESVVVSRFEALRGPALSPLIGRDEEIDLMFRRWARARAGEGQIVLVSGEPGIGKSRLIAALEEQLQAEPHRRLRYFCSPYHQDSALFPFIDQLGHAAGFARDDMPAARLEKLEAVLARAAPPDEDVALLADLLSLSASERHPLPNLSPQRKKERTLEALIRQIEGLALRQPVVVVFEDAHWIDPTSRELLDIIVDRVPSLPMLLIVTLRREFQLPWIGQPRVTMLALNRLDRRDRTALIAHIAGGKALPDDVVAQIAERTDGVPLFVEELTKSVLESGVLREAADRYVLDHALPPFAIPTTLHDSLMERLDRLAPVRQVAQIGAAIGRQFSYALLRAVAGLPGDELQAALAQLVGSELVFQRGAPPDAVYTFKHALVQDAAHGSLLRNTRQQLHAQIAEALETHSPELIDSQPELFAQHYAEAGLDEPAIEWWGKAGDQALCRSAFKEAAAHLRKAIALADKPSATALTAATGIDRLHLQISLGNALIWAKGYHAPETTAAFARARELASRVEDASERFSAYYGLWIGQLTRCEPTPMRETAGLFLQEAAARPNCPEAVIAHRISGTTYFYFGDFADAHDHYLNALELYDQARHSDFANRFGPDPRVAAEIWDAITLWVLGRIGEALRLADDALTDAESAAHAPTMAYALFHAALLGVFRYNPEAVAAYSQALADIVSRYDLSALWAGTALFFQGWAKRSDGAEVSRLAWMQRGIAINREQGGIWLLPSFEAALAEAEAGAGEADAGLGRLDDALAALQRTEGRWYEVEMHRIRAEILLKRDPTNTVAAEQALQTAVRIAQSQKARSFELRAALALAKLYRAAGRDVEALAVLAPAAEGFPPTQQFPELAEAQALFPRAKVNSS